VPCQANPMFRGSQEISVGFPVSSGAREPAPVTSQLLLDSLGQEDLEK